MTPDCFAEGNQRPSCVLVKLRPCPASCLSESGLATLMMREILQRIEASQRDGAQLRR
ncbi:hypothetical protein GOA80_21775 [Sinorhizobium meliloti]|nr:hypothetical protein [Sinorhizobium meliloti]